MKVMCTYVNSDTWMGVLEKLHIDYHVDYCCLIAKKKYQRKIEKKLGNPLFHDTGEIKYWDPEPDFVRANVSQKLLESMSYYETIFLKMMDRYGSSEGLSLSGMTFAERSNRYFSVLSHWFDFLNTQKPDLVIFNYVPHMGVDWIIYGLCQVCGIKTLLFYPSSPLTDVSLPFNNLEEGAWYLGKKSKNYVLGGAAKQRLKAIKSSYANGKPKYIDFTKERYMREKYSYKVFLQMLKLGFRAAFFAKNFSAAQKRKLWMHQSTRRREIFKKSYMAKSESIDLNAFSYIYVAFQVEPEAQVCPMGGRFSHQFLMVEQIAACLPEGWKIIVKEHTNAFSRYPDRAKFKGYYEKILKIPYVVLADLSMNPYALIDNADLTASVSGTTCWESVVRGVPTLLFGYNWFSRCEGVFQVHTAEDCSNAIMQVKNGYKVSEGGVEAYLSTVEEYGINGYTYDFYAQYSNLTKEENINNVTKGIANYLSLSSSESK